MSPLCLIAARRTFTRGPKLSHKPARLDSDSRLLGERCVGEPSLSPDLQHLGIFLPHCVVCTSGHLNLITDTRGDLVHHRAATSIHQKIRRFRSPVRIIDGLRSQAELCVKAEHKGEQRLMTETREEHKGLMLYNKWWRERRQGDEERVEAARSDQVTGEQDEQGDDKVQQLPYNTHTHTELLCNRIRTLLKGRGRHKHTFSRTQSRNIH